ncbi:alpha/beta hydrolase family protein [Parvularcula marina]|uniref:alpha/beta hydrolase family protein n=1 Tax=Parvularcula marina TaxID=2292771 RepID=UPI00351325CF
MRRALFFLVVLSGFFSSAWARGLDDYIGDWAGNLNVAPGVSLPLVLHVTEAAGEYAASLDSPNQGAFGMAASNIALEDDGAIKLTFGDIGAVYTARLSEDGTAMTGNFAQNGASFDLTLVKDAEPTARIPRPQEPGEDRPYQEEEITFSAEGGPVLSGTFVIPEGKGPFLTVVMLNGSGPQDRDEYLPPFDHKPFLVLADHLARAGIASFRYDDRGMGSSEGSFASSTVNQFAGDAAAALALIEKRLEVRKAGYLGHSEGGVSAALAIGEYGAKPKFVVTLAGPFTNIGDVLIEQAESITLATGGSEAAAKAAMAQQKLFVDAVVNAETPEAACPLIQLYSASVPAAQRNQIMQLCTPYFWSLLRSDPAPHYRAYKGPVLALFGSKDVQVLAEIHAPIAEEIFRKRKGAEVIVFDGKNHLFQSAETGAMTEYGEIEETMSPEVMDRIAEWIADRR